MTFDNERREAEKLVKDPGGRLLHLLFFKGVRQQTQARRALLLEAGSDMDATDALFDRLLEDDFQRTHIDRQSAVPLAEPQSARRLGRRQGPNALLQLRAGRSVVQRFSKLNWDRRFQIESALWYCEPLNRLALS